MYTGRYEENIFWPSPRDACMEWDVPRQRGWASGSWRTAHGYRGKELEDEAAKPVVICVWFEMLNGCASLVIDRGARKAAGKLASAFGVLREGDTIHDAA
jgi:hypothetical protein